jgi:hypothetical protein|tara:strand:+ start:51 stop:302 length:252 start_codon:yes stop_codon:yes gene_type:complete
MDKKLVEYFINECKQEQEWKARYKSNHIEMDDFFKYSGEVERTSPIIVHYHTNKNKRVDAIIDYFNDLNKTRKNNGTNNNRDD